MKSYSITYRMAPNEGPTKTLYVEAPGAVQAVSKAREVLRLRYPHVTLLGCSAGSTFNSDSEEIYALTERLRADR